MKRIFLIISAVVIVFSSNVKADEGMWLPMLIDRLNYEDMQKLGCKLTAEEIYSVNNSSLKDAIVQFGGGCTGEIISKNGLILTNHHCGIGQIQAHSSVENDYLADGFWAKSYEEELANPGLTVSFLVRMEDVSEKVNAVFTDEMTEKERVAEFKKIAKEIKTEANNEGQYKVSVKPLFGGNSFYLFVYEVYEDVRLVATPPWGIGKFGADTDNWMWPRHKGDFCMFRVYTDKDGKPAKYSQDNVPMKPKHSLPISIKGVKKDDFAMILGYPGRTNRYMTSYGVKMVLEQTAPTVIDVRTKKLDIMRKDMDADKEVFIKYAKKQASVSNYWKYYIGQKEQLSKNNVYDKKLKLEKEFAEWVNKDDVRKKKYGEVFNYYEEAYKTIAKYEVAKNYFFDAVYRGSEIIGLSMSFRSFNDHAKKGVVSDELLKRANKSIDKHFKDYNLPTDKKIFAAMMQMYYENVEVEQQPEYFRKLVKKNKEDYNKLTNTIFKKSIFADEVKLRQLTISPKTVDKDPVYKLMMSFLKAYWGIDAYISPASVKLDKAKRLYQAGLHEMQTDKTFYPDANFTMRVTYGTVQDYYPADAIYYSYETTMDGVMEKEIPGNWEFDVPVKLKDLYERKDYGKYGKDGKMIVNFITNNDITGGNSGSPVIDGEGNLIGLAFDGNWEAMSGDIEFEPDLQRTICVDARYLLFVMDKFAGAQNLIDELEIIE